MKTTSLTLPAFLFAAFAIVPQAILAMTWYITPDGTGDAPTIQAGIDSAAAGDTVLVACGTYQEFGIELKSGVLLRSGTGQPDCVTIDAQQQGLILWADEWTNAVVIEGLTLTGGYNTLTRGGALEAVMAGVTLRDSHIIGNAGVLGGGVASVEGGGVILERCLFADNTALDGSGGALAVGSSAQVTDCTFRNNTATEGGGAVSMSGFGTIHFTGCQFYSNESYGGSAIWCTMTMDSELTNCTLYGNTALDGETGAIFNLDGVLNVHNCIIAFNTGESITGFLQDISCTDIYENSGGDWVGSISDQADVNGNFSADPCFCDADNGDLHLCADSWCLPENNLWGCTDLVGVFGLGCDDCDCPSPLPGDNWSWGGVKALYW